MKHSNEADDVIALWMRAPIRPGPYAHAYPECPGADGWIDRLIFILA